eukprot:1139102-Pelagomonas_calceolata.AAC.2
MNVRVALHAQSDSKAMALFAYEISQILQERSLECSIASALSVVSCPQLGKWTETLSNSQCPVPCDLSAARQMQ